MSVDILSLIWTKHSLRILVRTFLVDMSNLPSSESGCFEGGQCFELWLTYCACPEHIIPQNSGIGYMLGKFSTGKTKILVTNTAINSAFRLTGRKSLFTLTTALLVRTVVYVSCPTFRNLYFTSFVTCFMTDDAISGCAKLLLCVLVVAFGNAWLVYYEIQNVKNSLATVASAFRLVFPPPLRFLTAFSTLSNITYHLVSL